MQVIGKEVLVAVKPILAKSQHVPGVTSGARGVTPPSSAAKEPQAKRSPEPPRAPHAHAPPSKARART
jgi:hypothetical protein